MTAVKQAGPLFKAQCPILSPFFWRKGGSAQATISLAHKEHA
jgi:hypothetical protein